MRSSVRNRFTIYDAMEARGAFESNPANADSRDPTEGTSLYKGPVEYPKMFYHPEGEEEVLNPGEVVYDPLSQKPKIIGQTRQMVCKTAANAEEEHVLRNEGWHDHPAKALQAAGKEAPPISSQARIDDLEAQLRRAQQELEQAKTHQLPARAAPVKSQPAAAD